MLGLTLVVAALVAAASADAPLPPAATLPVRPEGFPKPGQVEFNCHENIVLEAFAYYEVKTGQTCVDAIPAAQPIFTVAIPNTNLADFCKPPSVDFRFCALSDEEVNRLYAEQFPGETSKPVDFIHKVSFAGVNPRQEHLVPHCIRCPLAF